MQLGFNCTRHLKFWQITLPLRGRAILQKLLNDSNCTQSHTILYTYCSMESDVIALKVIQFYIHIVPCSLMLLHSKSFSFIYILFHAVWCYCTQSHSVLYTYCSMQSDVIELKVIQFIYILFHAVGCYCTQSHSVLYTYCSMQSDVIALKVIQFYIHIVPCSLM